MRRSILVSSFVALAAWWGAAAAGAPGGSPVPTPPPTPVPPFGSPSPFPTALATPIPTLRPPQLEARSAILEDLDTGQVLFSLQPDVARPIASLTKIMTAYLVLTRERPRRMVTVSEEAARLGAHNVGLSELGLQEGERLRIRDLLEALLLQSANDSAVALADAVSDTTDDFISLMNRTAAQLGLARTRFASPNGLDDRGHSTARSLAALTRAAERIPLFAKLVRTKTAAIPGPDELERVVQNRNVLLWLYPGAVGVKTGYTAKAGYCLVAAASVGGQRLLSVVLDEPSSVGSFSDAAALLDYGFHSFLSEQVIDVGQQFRATVDGTRYLFSAAAPLRAWILSSERDAPTFDVGVPPGVALRPGGTTGHVVARLHGRVLGSVPLVVATALGPAPPPGGHGRPPQPPVPWWARGLRSLSDAASGLYHSVFG